MRALGDFLRWFSGGPNPYMPLAECLNGDTFWITLTVVLDLSVALGYVLIAKHWWENEKLLPASQAKLALGNMKRIFLFCGTCGYLFIPIKLVWPAWRLYDLVMIGLVFFTWRYALNSRQLRVVYRELVLSSQLADQLEESRAESRRKSHFLNAISHDLRTPLNGLMLQAELAELSYKTEDAESLTDSLREIKASARTTADLLGGFLEMARLDWSEDPSQESSFPLDELIDQVLNLARPPAVGRGLELRHGPSRAIRLRTDRVKLGRILQNIVGNAVKFTDSGRIEVEVEASGRDVVIHVNDTGVGIPADKLSTIFEVFYQVGNQERDRSKGFGLGLAIARKLTTQLRGDLAVESEVGKGSRFTLNLPGIVEAIEPGRAPSTARPIPAARVNPASATLG